MEFHLKNAQTKSPEWCTTDTSHKKVPLLLRGLIDFNLLQFKQVLEQVIFRETGDVLSIRKKFSPEFCFLKLKCTSSKALPDKGQVNIK